MAMIFFFKKILNLQHQKIILKYPQWLFLTDLGTQTERQPLQHSLWLQETLYQAIADFYLLLLTFRC